MWGRGALLQGGQPSPQTLLQLMQLHTNAAHVTPAAAALTHTRHDDHQHNAGTGHTATVLSDVR